MNDSLEKLAKSITISDMKYTSQEFHEVELMKRKGVYPYDYMDSFDKFNDKNLPSKEKLFCMLSDEHITDKDYEHAQNVCNTFNLESMGQYHDLYLKSDVLLLADVFEKFRKTYFRYYKLDPCHYFTSPGLSWDAMLKKTGVKVKLMPYIDQLYFIERRIRGGVSYICKKYAKANNKYISDYDPTKPSSYIKYLDANNLYGWAMSEELPTGGFKWAYEIDLTRKSINWVSFDEIISYNLIKKTIIGLDLTKKSISWNSTEKSNKGLILEVDLDYPEHLHDKHNDYLLAPESLEIKNHMLSEYCKKFNIKVGRVKRLVPNLGPKKNYVFHYKN